MPKKKKVVPCVIGIDPSYTGFAMCVMRTAPAMEIGFKMYEWKTMTAAGMVGRIGRVKHLVANAMEVVEEHKPQLVVIENYAFGARNSKTLTMLAELGGALRRDVIFFEAPKTKKRPLVIEVSPTMLKMFATGKGRAQKQDVAFALGRDWMPANAPMISKRFGCFKTDNQADAYGLAAMGAMALGCLDPQHKHHKTSCIKVQEEIAKELKAC